MTLISKNVNIDEVDDIKTIEQLDIYHRTIKMKSVDVDANMCIDFNKENIKGSPNLKIGDNVRISKYKTVIGDLNGEKPVGTSRDKFSDNFLGIVFSWYV